MKLQTLKSIIEKKKNKSEFAIITNLETGESEIFEKDKSLSKEMEVYSNQINEFFKSKKNGVIENSEIFVETYILPIKVIVVGAVHIAQYLVDYAKSLNFEISIIDPRGYFASEQRFPDMKIINKWPNEAFKEIETNENTALIALTHDPKIDDPALNYALKNKFFYVGALGSKKTHIKRCQRLRETGFSEKEISSIYGPIGIKLGGKSTPEIALSIVAQLVSKTNDLLLNSKD
jgi:xanthine dehydrogenase accessory factor